jgi:hypothetical protein
MRDHTSKLDMECVDYLRKISADNKKAGEGKTNVEITSLAYAAGT